MKEADVLRAILDYLAIRHIKAWRMNTGAALAASGRFVRFGSPGMSDIIGILDDGRFLAIEVKGPNGKATEAQLIFMAEVAKRKGVAFVARSVEDVIEHLKEAMK